MTIERGTMPPCLDLRSSTSPLSNTPPQHSPKVVDASSGRTDSAARPPSTTCHQLPSSIQSTKPPEPHPWRWSCHKCGNWYHLSVTRRCLHDGHFFCTMPVPIVSPALSVVPEDVERWDGNRTKARWQLDMEQKRRQKERAMRRRMPKGCKSQFDYNGWSALGGWKRKISRVYRHTKSHSFISPNETGPITRSQTKMLGRSWKDDRRDSFWERTGPRRDCWSNCDYPSQCLNEWEGEVNWTGAWGLEASSHAVSLTDDQDSDLAESSEYIEHVKDFSPTDEKDIQEDIWEDIYGSEASSSCPSSEDDKGDEDIGSPGGPANTVDWTDGFDQGLGPTGTDSDGLGEEIDHRVFEMSKRKKSLGGATSPLSPLKVSFGIEEGSRPNEEVVDGLGEVDLSMVSKSCGSCKGFGASDSFLDFCHRCGHRLGCCEVMCEC